MYVKTTPRFEFTHQNVSHQENKQEMMVRMPGKEDAGSQCGGSRLRTAVHDPGTALLCVHTKDSMSV